MLHIALLGGLKLEAGDREIPAPDSRRARALLAWLALHPGPHGRSQVAGVLRPDVSEEDARRSLRQATWLAGRALGDAADGALIATRAEVGLDPAAVAVDVRALREQAAAGDFESARALRARPLLPELDEEWAIAAREELRADVAELLAQHAAAAERAGDPDAAVRWARERAGADPLSEVAQTELMRLLHESGDRAAALQVADALRRRLSEELGVTPSADTRAAIEAVLTSDDRPSGPSRPRPSAPAPRVPAPAAAPPVTPAPIQLPAPLATIASEPLVGRADPLARVERAWEQARRGTPGLVVLSGEAGIGKTRLTAEIATQVAGAGGAILYGRCAEEPLASYQPFTEALERGVEDGVLPIAALPEVYSSELARMLPRVAADGPPPAEPDSDPQLARYRMFEGVRAALGIVAGDRPLLVALDDMQWADPGGSALLNHLCGRLRDERLLIVMTFRDGPGADSVARLVAQLRRHRPVDRVALEPLDAGAVAALAPDPSAAEQIHRHTGGNPLFVVETLRQGDGAAVPAPLRELIDQRLEALGADALGVLRGAAVAGLEFELADVRTVCQLDEDDLIAALDRAVEARLIREEAGAAGVYQFAHALVAEAIYAGMSGARRGRLHARLGESLAERDAPASAVAHHLLAATPPVADLTLTLTWARRAAEDAMAALAYGDAVAILRRALPHATDDARRGRLLVRLGDALERDGDRAQAREAFAQAAQHARIAGDSATLAAAALGFKGLVVTVTASDPETVALLEEALGAVGDGDPALTARLQAALALETYYEDLDGARRRAAEAVELARGARDPATLAHTLSAQHLALWDPDHAHDRIGIATEMARLARASGDRVALLQARNWRVVDLFDLGQIAAVVEEIDAYEQEATELRVPRLEWYVPLWRAAIAILRGDWDDAERLSAEAGERGVAAGDPNAAGHRSIQRNWMLGEQGRIEEIDIDQLERSAAESPSGRGAWIGWLAWILHDLGEVEAGRRYFDELAADDFAAVPRDANWHSMCEAAESAVRYATPEQISTVRRMLAPYERLTPVMGRGIGSIGPVAYYLGHLAAEAGDTDEAMRLFRWTVDYCDKVGARPRAEVGRQRLDELTARAP